MTSDVWAVVPARTGPTAKRRLSALFGPEERAALVLAMLVDVLRACADAGLAGTVAVVADGAGERVAWDHGAEAIRDGGHGMNPAVAAGVRRALARGAGAALVVPGDVPLVRADDLRAVLAAGGTAPGVVVVPDRFGVGTNALLLRPPGAVEPCFEGASAARHRAAAIRAGAAVRRLELPGLALDVDTPEDVTLIRRARAGRETAAFLAGAEAPLAL